MPYDYKTSLIHDIKNFMEDTNSFNIDEYETLDELADYLNDRLWSEDSVTGNASGSYTNNCYDAKQHVLDNMNLAVEMAREFDCKDRFMDWLFDDDYESIDVSIRCYLLRSAIDEVIDNIEDDFNANRERIEEEFMDWLFDDDSENDTEE